MLAFGQVFSRKTDNTSRIRHLWMFLIGLILIMPAASETESRLSVGASDFQGYVGKNLEILNEHVVFEHLQIMESLPEDFRDLVLSGKWSSSNEIHTGIQRTSTGEYRLDLQRIETGETAVVEWSVQDVMIPEVSDHFVGSGDDIPLLDFTGHAYWFRLRLHNPLDESVQIMVELDKTMYSWFDLTYSLNGINEFLRGSYEDPVSQRTVPENKVYFPAILDPGPQDLYFRMDSPFVDTVPIRLWTTAHHYRRNNIRKFFHGFTSGATMLLLVYALFLAYTWKERGYLYLAMLILFGNLVHLSDSGLGMTLFWPESPMGSIALFSLAFPLTIIANLLFCRHYLPAKRYTPITDRILLLILCIAGLIALVQFFIPINSRYVFSLSALLLDYLSVVPLLFAAFTAFRRESKGNRLSAFLLAAISFQLLSYLEYWLSRLNLLPLELIDFLHIRSLGFVLVMLGGVRYKVRSLKNTVASLRERLDGIVAEKAAETAEKPLTDQTQIKVEAVRELLEQNYTEPLYRDDLAASVGLSGDHLGRMFKRLTGVRISEYLNRIRIKEACSRLEQHSDIKIIDIAFEVGFENLRTFNLCFARQMGLSPSDYRRTQSAHDRAV